MSPGWAANRTLKSRTLSPLWCSSPTWLKMELKVASLIQHRSFKISSSSQSSAIQILLVPTKMNRILQRNIKFIKISDKYCQAHGWWMDGQIHESKWHRQMWTRRKWRLHMTKDARAHPTLMRSKYTAWQNNFFWIPQIKFWALNFTWEQGSTLTLARLPGASRICPRASKSSPELAREGKWVIHFHHYNESHEDLMFVCLQKLYQTMLPCHKLNCTQLFWWFDISSKVKNVMSLHCLGSLERQTNIKLS